MATVTQPFRINAADLRDPNFWRARFPELDLSAPSDVARFASDMEYGEAERARNAERMAEDGYIHGAHPALGTLAPMLAQAGARCIELGLPPVFLFLFNDVWRCFYALKPALDAMLGPGFYALPDFWFWHVDPRKGEAGWAPHADKGPFSLDPQGRPLSVTVWIALSKATPLNSCIYVLPASRDRGYLQPEQRRIDLTQIRALPTAPGEFLCWNQAVFHWGSAASRFADEPRISMALEFQSAAAAPFNQPLIADPDALDFEAKLRLVAKQILQYRHMYAVDPGVESLALALQA